MKRGVPPTALNARTGEFTPPGVTAWARSKSARWKRGRDWRVVTGLLSRRPQGRDDSAVRVRAHERGCLGPLRNSV